ncbi:MAG: stage 0 sporulation family protein [Oscillospiraceae bacterium]|nr:stage 0 sporulation family protein [Oscillospiraceae bacterium]
MKEIIGVRFRDGGKIYSFDPGSFSPRPGDKIVVETARGLELGIVADERHLVEDEKIIAPLRKTVRMANPVDIKTASELRDREKKAITTCQEKADAHNLEMKIINAECSFDGSKIIFYFTADGRIDFRALVKDLASVFRTRIELRQIGVRDEAKMLGGLGICGRPFCCASFLDDFQPVSIKMAKEQNLSLNQAKISGTCGRLMCCLKYEQEAYEDLIRTTPKVGAEVDTPAGPGTVADVSLIAGKLRVKLDDDSDEVILKTFNKCDVCPRSAEGCPHASAAHPRRTKRHPKAPAKTAEAQEN